MSREIKLYLAGPFGFSEAGRDFYYSKLIPLIESTGCQVLDPWKLAPQDKIEAVQAMAYGIEKQKTWRKVNLEIGENNQNLIDGSDGIIAILDGPDVDSGTAAEIGYAFGQGKCILGYRGDFRLSAENEGGIVNLQVEYFIRKSGGTLITTINDLQKEIRACFK